MNYSSNGRADFVCKQVDNNTLQHVTCSVLVLLADVLMFCSRATVTCTPAKAGVQATVLYNKT